MNNMIKVGLLTVGLGLALQAAEANAAVATYTTYSNAVNYCQAFTPGPSNTIRNRVIGSENIGTPIALACNLESMFNGAAGNTNLKTLQVYFSNGSTAATTVTCTMLTGTSTGLSAGTVYSVPKTSGSIPAGSAGVLTWTQADNPTSGAVDFGNLLVGVNCNVPTNVTISVISTQWSADNGV